MAMGITQALKLQEGPIDALAKLPQQQLIQMAQQGRIPADMLPVILNEKAQMAQAAANMQAMQQPMPPSVIEQAMATNAQAEAQSQMPPMDAGVASLPLPEDAYSMAGGGIVAFDEGGEIKTAPRRGIDLDRLKEIQGQITSAREAIPFGEGYEAYKKYLQGQDARAATEAYQDKWMRLLQAGLGITGGESPYALTNIGKGSQAAAAGAMEDAARRRKEAGESLKGRAELDRLTRAEKLEALKSAESMYGKEVDRIIAAESKSNEMKDYVKFKADAAQLNGDTRPRAVIEAAFATEFQKYRFDPRMLSAHAAMGASNVGASRESTQDYEAAAKIVDPMIARGGSKYKEYKRIRDTEGQEAADAFREKQIANEITRMRGGRGSTAPTAPATPAASAPKIKTPPQAAIDLLIRDPSDVNKKYFDQTFGSGAAARALAK